MQDDGESYANDQPGDDFYDFNVGRFRTLLAQQLANVIPYFDHEKAAARATEIMLPVDPPEVLHIPKESAHARLQIVFDLIEDDAHRARFANEALVLLEGLTLIQRGRV